MSRTVLTLLLLAGALALCPDARGDLYLRFEVPLARPGQTVVAFLGDANGRAERVNSIGVIHAYLVPARDRISPLHQIGTGPPTSSAWLPLGRLRKAPDGTVTLRFQIPADLLPGLYTIGFWCIPCAPPKGAAFTGAYPNQAWKPGRRYQKLLRVSALKPAGGVMWKAWEIAALAIAVAAFAASLGALLYRRRHASQQSLVNR